jgi:hypothetical protein
MRRGRAADVTSALFSTAPALRGVGLLSGPTTTIGIVEQWWR